MNAKKGNIKPRTTHTAATQNTGEQDFVQQRDLHVRERIKDKTQTTMRMGWRGGTYDGWSGSGLCCYP
jgi:hypothetical protein